MGLTGGIEQWKAVATAVATSGKSTCPMTVAIVAGSATMKLSMGTQTHPLSRVRCRRRRGLSDTEDENPFWGIVDQTKCRFARPAHGSTYGIAASALVEKFLVDARLVA